MQLLKEFGISDDLKTVAFCREAYKFLMEGDVIKVVGADANGNALIERVVNTPSAEPVAVDLGLPSGTLWCDRNVGAASPEDYGAFFSWGNTEPHYPNRDNMDWGDDDNGFDYSFDSDTYKETEGYKLEGNIDTAHDAARINMGEPWQMPTDDQFKELYDNCDWVRKTINGVNGYLVTSKVNGNAIFFPASGYWLGASLYNRGTNGLYWSSTFGSASNVCYLYFNSGAVFPQYYRNRWYGFSVRAVQNCHQK